ncbi:hypothetical protein RN001_012358 [Aquatica leii]|uniref:Peptidase A2 domain-containing protein n=1 Tax=Aquatica leii TaxID=1421715 RepID=A0AAN7P624_9COLE|nr:hypothetical protein RN001_012358 [Aquatica leii]
MASTMENVGHLREFNPQTCDWQIFKSRMENFFVANEIKDEDRKRAIVLNILNEEAYKLVFNLCLPTQPEKMKYVDLLRIITEHFKPQQSVFSARYKFYNAKKIEYETPKEWAARLRSLAAHCQFEESLEIALRDQFLMGYEKGAVQDRLFEEDVKVTFAKVIDIATSKMATRSTSIETSNLKKDENLYQVASTSQSSKFKQGTHMSQQGKMQKRSAQVGTYSPCLVCGRVNHLSKFCFHKNLSCNICNLKGHLATVCNNKIKQSVGKGKRNTRTVHNIDDNSSCDDNLQLFSIDNVNTDRDFTIEVKIENKQIKFQIDSGASISAINYDTYVQNFSNIAWQRTDKRLFLYNKQEMKPVGICTLNVRYKEKNENIDFYIIENGGIPL